LFAVGPGGVSAPWCCGWSVSADGARVGELDELGGSAVFHGSSVSAWS
jgi:hypothetical protein